MVQAVYPVKSWESRFDPSLCSPLLMLPSHSIPSQFSICFSVSSHSPFLRATSSIKINKKTKSNQTGTSLPSLSPIEDQRRNVNKSGEACLVSKGPILHVSFAPLTSIKNILSFSGCTHRLGVSSGHLQPQANQRNKSQENMEKAWASIKRFS